jgi:hypothetical protein
MRFGASASFFAIRILAAVLALAGCVPVAITAAGVGGSAAVSHTLNGITYKTFTLPSADVHRATLKALARMGFKVTGTGKDDDGAEVITALAHDREITITIEALSASATRMKVVARNGGIFYDSATATEIILQTGRGLGVA